MSVRGRDELERLPVMIEVVEAMEAPIPLVISEHQSRQVLFAWLLFLKAIQLKVASSS